MKYEVDVDHDVQLAKKRLSSELKSLNSSQPAIDYREDKIEFYNHRLISCEQELMIDDSLSNSYKEILGFAIDQLKWLIKYYAKDLLSLKYKKAVCQSNIDEHQDFIDACDLNYDQRI